MLQEAAVSLEKVVDHLNQGFVDLVNCMSTELGKIGGDAAPLASLAADFIVQV